MKELKVNQGISASRVVLIEQDGKSLGEVSFDQAMYLAYEAGLDLVQVNSDPVPGKPPVCRIMDYGKYRYAQEKQLSKQKVKSKAPEIKEVRLSFKIDSHDMQVKANQAKKFLDLGDKVKVTVKLVGREMMFSSKVSEILDEFKKIAIGEYEGKPERMGNRFSSILSRK